MTTITMTQYVPPINTVFKPGFIRNLAPVGSAPLPDDLADTYGLARGTITTYRHRIGGESVDGEKPICLLKYYYLTQITDDQIARMNADASVDIWPEISPIEVTCHDTLTSRLPTAEEASLLKISNTMPIVEVQSMTTTTTGDTPILIQQSVFAGTSFAYNYNYTRP